MSEDQRMKAIILMTDTNKKRGEITGWEMAHLNPQFWASDKMWLLIMLGGDGHAIEKRSSQGDSKI